VPPLLLHPHIKTAIIVLLQTGAFCALLPLAAVSNHQYIHNRQYIHTPNFNSLLPLEAHTVLDSCPAFGPCLCLSQVSLVLSFGTLLRQGSGMTTGAQQLQS